MICLLCQRSGRVHWLLTPGELDATPSLPISPSPSLAVTLSVSFSLSFFLYILLPFIHPPPSPYSSRPCGIEALRQQCKGRRDELLVYTFNLGWQGGQKKWSLEVPGGTSSPLPPWLHCGMTKIWAQFFPVSQPFIFNSTPQQSEIKEVVFIKNPSSCIQVQHPLVLSFYILPHSPWMMPWLRCPPLDTGLTLRGAILAPLGVARPWLCSLGVKCNWHPRGIRVEPGRARSRRS